MKTLENKVAIVTGSGSGIGKAIAIALCLNSDKASFITGSYYNVDGGYLAR